MSLSSYQALALQVRCDAVNLLDIESAREQMLKTIDRYAGLLRGSIGFLSTFSGTPVRLVVLPEYFLTGFPLGESIEQWKHKACILPTGPEYEKLSALAQSQKVYLSGNVYEIDPAFPELYFQVSFIIADNGDVVLRYRRLISMYSPTPHDVLDKFVDFYGEEALFPVVDTELGKLACVASEEILFPEVSRALALRGAEVLCHSSSEVGSPKPTPKNVAKQARAYENIAYVVSANSAGIAGIPFPEHSTDGASQVVGYNGQVMAKADTGESMVGNAKVDIEALREARVTPSMSNMLARQRLEIFAQTYSARSVYPANNLCLDQEVIVPERSHFLDCQSQALQRLKKMQQL